MLTKIDIQNLTPYKRLSGNSSVESYKYDSNSIIVKFISGSNKFYLYSTNKNLQSEIDKMKECADNGIGLGAMLATKPHHEHDDNW